MHRIGSLCVCGGGFTVSFVRTRALPVFTPGSTVLILSEKLPASIFRVPEFCFFPGVFQKRTLSGLMNLVQVDPP